MFSTIVPLLLQSNDIGKLVRIPGIIIGASTLNSRASTLHLVCRSCSYTTEITVEGGFTPLQIPRICGRFVDTCLISLLVTETHV